MLEDIGFAYHQLLVDEDAFVQQEWIWAMVYFISYLVLIAGLIWFIKISEMINKNIQSTIEKQYPDLEKLWKSTEENSESTNSENEKEYTEYQIDKQDQVNQKITNILETAQKEILFLISTREMVFNIKNEMYRFMKIINTCNIENRVLIPESSKSPELASELYRFPRINIQYLYKTLNENFALLIIDTQAIVYIRFDIDDNSLEDDKYSLFYSNKEHEVQSYIALFESCWILSMVHE